MREHWIVGVFGISGVGKSTLITEARERVPKSLHLQGSALIQEGLADPRMDAEALRRLSLIKFSSISTLWWKASGEVFAHSRTS